MWMGGGAVLRNGWCRAGDDRLIVANGQCGMEHEWCNVEDGGY